MYKLCSSPRRMPVRCEAASSRTGQGARLEDAIVQVASNEADPARNSDFAVWVGIVHHQPVIRVFWPVLVNFEEGMIDFTLHNSQPRP